MLDLGLEALDPFIDTDPGLEGILSALRGRPAFVRVENALKDMGDVKYTKVFFMLSSSKKVSSSIVEAITESDRGHVSLSLDASFDRMYAFAAGGFKVETKDSYVPHAEFTIYSLKVPTFIVDAMRDKCEALLKSKTVYAVSSILKGALRMGDTEDLGESVCSSFIVKLFKMFNIPLFDQSPNRVAPGDFANHPSFKFESKGEFRDFEHMVTRISQHD